MPTCRFSIFVYCPKNKIFSYSPFTLYARWRPDLNFPEQSARKILPMETDESSNPPSGEDLTSVLHQFSCLGTTDKDVLVSQLQKLVGPQLNSSAAHFFLDMNNWNLQLAIGAYFDLTSDNPESDPVHKMQLQSDVEECIVPPFTKFIKSWRITNSGPAPWPTGSFLKQKSGDQMAVQAEVYINPVVQPGETRTISVEFLSPPHPGNYNCRFQMCTPEGRLFGDEIWAIVQVQLDSTVSITEGFDKLTTCDEDMNVL